MLCEPAAITNKKRPMETEKTQFDRQQTDTQPTDPTEDGKQKAE